MKSTKEKLMETLTEDDKAYFADKACADKIIDLLVANAVETEEEPAKDEAPKAE
jgi:hypothetical protein